MSQVSTKANSSRLASIRSATLFSILARSETDVFPQASFAVFAAATALFTSSFWERGYFAINELSIGEVLSKYSPPTGFTNFPLMKFPYFSLNFGFE